jgi:hypothetical protein
MNLHLSPRLGFNWDVTGNQKNQLRGGVGVFMGPPPFVFMSNTFTNTGNNFSQLVCDPITNRGTTVPLPTGAFATTAPPASCPSGQAITAFDPNGTVGTVNTVADNLKFPQVMRATLGYDRDLGNDWVATVEGTYTYGLNDLFYQNLNQAAPLGTDRNGRSMYGTIAVGASGGIPTRAAGRIATYVGQENGVFDASNVSGAWSSMLMTQLRKRFANGWEINGSYTYQQSRSVIDATSSVARSNFINGRVLSGNSTDTQLGVSAFQMPHRFVLTGTYTAPWKSAPTDIAFNFSYQSGTPVVWTATGTGSNRGDLNADGYVGNDAIYVPRSATDAGEMLFQTASFFVPAANASRSFTAAEQAAAFERFIEGQSCLRNQRGQILERNSCQNPWWSTLDMSVRQSLPSIVGQRVQLQFEIFNLPNMLNASWGKIRTRGQFPGQSVLNVVSAQNDAQGRPQMVYTFDPRDADEPFRITNSVANFYRVQLGVRYAF